MAFHHCGYDAMASPENPIGRLVKQPGPEHPITVSPYRRKVTVKVANQVVATTRHALSLKEASYPAVLYIPRDDVNMSLLAASDLTTYCPYKGECAYYSIPLGGTRSLNAVWTYNHPYEAVTTIKDHLAFYPDRVDSIECDQD